MIKILAIFEDKSISATPVGPDMWEMEIQSCDGAGNEDKIQTNSVGLGSILALTIGVGEEPGLPDEVVKALYKVAEKAIEELDPDLRPMP